MDALTRLLTSQLIPTCLVAVAVALTYAVGRLSGRRAEAGRWAAHAGGGPVRHRGVEYAVSVLGVQARARRVLKYQSWDQS